jgi:hypothetical protein
MDLITSRVSRISTLRPNELNTPQQRTATPQQRKRPPKQWAATAPAALDLCAEESGETLPAPAVEMGCGASRGQRSSRVFDDDESGGGGAHRDRKSVV